MLLREIYIKDINRHLNPAVSATKIDDTTAGIEIEEYVFTDEIISGLYRILNAIRHNEPFEHIGIWIDGYYGSGKSHFLKYLDYCFDPRYSERALGRLLDEVRLIDPFDEKLDPKYAESLSDARDNLPEIANWLKTKAEVETRIFNLETSHDLIKGQKNSFLQVFWSEFNKQRGLNPHNLAMAQFLEKPLMEVGVFDEFKRRVAELKGDWSNPEKAVQIFAWKRKTIFEIVHELVPDLDTESIAKAIDNNQLPMTIEFFGKELSEWINSKSPNYRLIMLADEVSQFINKERDRYLNLQEIITYLSEVCHNRVWVVCTAQQDLSEILDDCNIGEEKDHEGKIKGRFEVKVSLKGTQPEVITQKRILEKKSQAKAELSALYSKEHDGFSSRFPLPNGYKSFETEEDFVDYYPFVPYQFRLIMQVFNNFLNLGYVAKEVKGNERSIIKVVHSTAKRNSEAAVGKLISFDELYNNMFEEGLTNSGHNAVKPAFDIAEKYVRDPEFARSIVTVLFMISNISDNDKIQFPANLTNLTILLVKDFHTPFLTIRDNIKRVLDYLCDNNVIREEEGKAGTEPHYTFYSDEEMKVAKLISNQDIDSTIEAEQFKDIFLKYFQIEPKVQYMNRSFSVGTSIMGRTSFGNNPDVTVEFDMDNDTEADVIMNNMRNRLVFLAGPLLRDEKNKRLYGDFRWYCKFQRYIKTIAETDETANVRKEFQDRASKLYLENIVPGMQKIIDECQVFNGQNVCEDEQVTAKRGKERYRNALNDQLASMFPKAKLVAGSKIPHDVPALRAAINRSINPGDYDGIGAVLTEAEKEVEIYLENQHMEMNLADIVLKFSKSEYGWDKIATLYIVNELVRRHRRDYSYSNNPTVSIETVVAHLVDETNKFTVRKGVAISQETVNGFIAAWKKVFGPSAYFSSSDSTQIYNSARSDKETNGLRSIIHRYQHTLQTELKPYAFSNPMSDAVDLFESWMDKTNIEDFFKTVTADADKGAEIIDAVRKMLAFKEKQIAIYDNIVNFINANRLNFNYLPDSYKPVIDELSALPQQKWPFRIRDYKDKMDELSVALDEVRKKYRQEIREEYEKTFIQLEELADSIGVSRNVIADKESSIAEATCSNNILVLRENKDTDQLFQQQAAALYTAKQKQDSHTSGSGSGDSGTSTSGSGSSGANGAGGNGSEVHEPHPVFVKLVTRSTAPLTTEADIDAYLAKIKVQLMKHLGGDNIINVQ